MPRESSNKKSSSGRERTSSSRSRSFSTAPPKPFKEIAKAKPPPPPPSAVAPPINRGSRFREMAEMAGGVAVGSTIGHVVGQGIVGTFSRLFGGGGGGAGSRESSERDPCDFEYSKFLECYNRFKANPDELVSCDELYDTVVKCKEYYRSNH